MKFLKICAVSLGILLVSALLAPWIYAHTAFKFDRILSRLVMVFSLVAIFSTIRLRLSDLQRYGLLWGSNAGAFVVRGFLIGFTTLALLTVLEILLGGRHGVIQLDPWGTVFLKILEYLLAALVIGLVEEFFFRGFLYTHLRARLRYGPSVVVANLTYAILHFFKGGSYQWPESPGFLDGVKVILHLADSFLDFRWVGPSLFGLFLFGLILSYGYRVTGNLFLSIGIHAGCVFLLKVDNWFVESVPGASRFLFGDKNLHSGVLGWCFMGVLFLLLRKWFAKSENTHS